MEQTSRSRLVDILVGVGIGACVVGMIYNPRPLYVEQPVQTERTEQQDVQVELRSGLKVTVSGGYSWGDQGRGAVEGAQVKYRFDASELFN